jgi:serine/threonine protein kinase
MSEGIPLPPPEAVPKRIGKYRILRQIAQGGMAEIYLASASGIEGFEKLCVLKRILPLLATNREFVQMFLDEARIAASLMHSNVAQVFDIGSEAGSYYFVMEFLRGEDVRHILQSAVGQKSFIPLEHAATIVMGVCSGLHYAHEMRGKDGKRLQLVHRDISPQNVFVTHDGNVKLCDFGIAKSAAQLTETRVGTLKGKIRYMSPEQCRSESLDRRSDVFALSIVLWELLTLRRLFSGKSDFDIFKAIVEEPMPAPSQFRPDVPAQLESIVMKGLSREREDRFQTAQEMQLALEDWVRHDRVPASSVRLAAFMTELFGPPPPPESFLAEISEPSGRMLPPGDPDDLSPADAPDPQAALTVAMRAPSAEAPTAGRTLPPMPNPRSDSQPSITAESDASMRLGRPAPRALVLAACGICATAVALLVLRGPSRTPAPTPVTPPPSAVAEPARTPETPLPRPTPPAAEARPATASDGLRVPVAPPVEPQRPAVGELAPPAPAVRPTLAPKPAPTRAPARPKPAVHEKKPEPHEKKAEPPAKKSGGLDELLPP